MKTCTICKVEQQLSNFSKRTNSADGLQHRCNNCYKIYRNDNKNQRKLICRKWQISNEDKYKLYNKQYKDINKNRVKEGKRVWQQDNAGKMRDHANNRRALKLKTTLNLNNIKEQIKAIYLLADTLQRINNMKYEVHHVIPLQEYSNIITGLHVPWNLEILTEEEHIEAHRKLREEFKLLV